MSFTTVAENTVVAENAVISTNAEKSFNKKAAPVITEKNSRQAKNKVELSPYAMGHV